MVEPPVPTRVAIEFLTLWMEPGDEARLRAAEHIAGVVHEPGGIGADAVIVGLLNLNMLTLLSLAKAQGATDIAVKAGDILREWSRQLPES